MHCLHKDCKLAYFAMAVNYECNMAYSVELEYYDCKAAFMLVTNLCKTTVFMAVN